MLAGPSGLEGVGKLGHHLNAADHQTNNQGSNSSFAYTQNRSRADMVNMYQTQQQNALQRMLPRQVNSHQSFKRRSSFRKHQRGGSKLSNCSGTADMTRSMRSTTSKTESKAARHPQRRLAPRKSVQHSRVLISENQDVPSQEPIHKVKILE